MIPENTDTYRDLLDAKIMGRLMARPSDVTAQFRTVQQEQGIIAATRQFYNLCIDSNYIRMDRVAKMNTGGTPARMAILRLPSISKPEKSPKEIAMAKLRLRRFIRNASSAARMSVTQAESITRHGKTCALFRWS